MHTTLLRVVTALLVLSVAGRGLRGVTPDTALRLEQLFGTEAQVWLNLQQIRDLYHAMHSPEAAAIR